MLIYRVEHRFRLNDCGHPMGPYIVEGDPDLEDFCWNLGATHSDEDHPPPGDIPVGWICGLESEQAVIDWFSGFLGGLDQHGFVMSCYEVTEDYGWTRTTGQIIFEPECATLQWDKNLVTLEIE